MRFDASRSADKFTRTWRKLEARTFRGFLLAYGTLRGHITHDFPRWFAHVEPVLSTPGPWALDIAAPRGFAKSTLLAEWWPLYEALINPAIGCVLIVSSSAELAAKRLRVIREQLEGNVALIEDFGELPDPKLWNVNEAAIFKPGQDHLPPEQRARCVFKVAGASTRLRGYRFGAHRPDIVIKDDVERDIRDLRQAEEFEEWEEGTLGEIGSPTVREVNVGNLTSYVTLALGKRLIGAPFTRGDGSEYGAVDPVSAEQHGHRHRFKFQALDDREDSLWPDHPEFCAEGLRTKRERMTPQTWAAELQNDPLDPSTATFRADLFGRERWYGPAVRNGDEARERWDGCGLYGAIDPAISKSTTADYTAIATVARDTDGMIYVLDVVWERWSFSETLSAIASEYRRWRWHWFGVETVAYQEALRQEVEAMARREQGLDIRVKQVRPDRDKVRRISTLEPLLRGGTLRTADEHGHIRNEFQFYRPERTHDDVLDAIEMAVHLARTTVKPGMAVAVTSKGGSGRASKPRDWYRRSRREWANART